MRALRVELDRRARGPATARMERAAGGAGRVPFAGVPTLTLIRTLRDPPTHDLRDGRAVFVVGHPNGLPAKVAGGARVRDNRLRALFVANLDSYGGNSGSPVFDQRTRMVEDILASGDDDCTRNGDCFVSLVCPDAGSRGESVTRSTLWAVHIPSQT